MSPPRLRWLDGAALAGFFFCLFFVVFVFFLHGAKRLSFSQHCVKQRETVDGEGVLRPAMIIRVNSVMMTSLRPP